MRIEVESPAGEDGDEESATAYVVDGGLFRVSRIDEVPSGDDASRPVRALHVVEAPIDRLRSPGLAAVTEAAPTAEEADVEEEPPIWEVDEEDAGHRGRRPRPLTRAAGLDPGAAARRSDPAALRRRHRRPRRASPARSRRRT